MAIHWKVQFRSLRANRLYTVNIYDDNYTGNPVSLIGAANPFETQEDDDDDMFKPVRTQSGYLKIVDTGDINWRDIIPTTDTDRPVTLTHEENNATVVDWIGFMQAQNFGARLYEVPIERDFPLQCPLSVLSRNDISTTNKDIQNFAWLLWSALNTIPSIARPTQIIVQGGADAIEWLLKRVDWFDFIDADKNHQPKAKYDYGSAIEDMCRFWGLTASIHGQTLYMTCADDAGESNALVMAYADLANLASGNYTPPSGIVVGDDDITIETMFTTVTIGDIFASIDNNDYQNRGPNKAVVKVDSNGADDDVIAPFDAELVKEMNRADWYEGTIINEDDDYWHYSKDVISVDRVDLDGYSVAQIPSLQDQERYYATFNLLSKYNGVDAGGGYSDVGNVIRFKRTYNGNVFMTLETKYEHCFANGFFRIFADTYRKGEKYENGNFFAGNPSMIMALGIGNSRSTAKWWNGQAWQSSATTFLASIGNKKPELFTRVESGYTLVYESSIIETTSTMCGRMFIDLLGTNDSRVEDDADGRKTFDLKDFHIEFSKNDNVTKQQYPNSGWYDVKDNLDEPELEYEAKSTSMVKEDYNVDSPYGGNDGIPPGYGILMNGDGSRMSTVPYNGDTERPEQHLVNRVVNYWATSKRRIECELLTHNGSAATVAAGISPRNKLSIDGSTMHPIAISRAWADDVATVVMMEVSDVVMYNIIANLTRITSNAPSAVEANASLHVTLTPNTGHYIDDSSVVVTMGGNDITSTAYSNGVITIAEVTGNVVITAASMFDAEVEYLESNTTTGGRAFVDTGIKVDNNVTFDIKANVQTAYDCFIIGGRTGYNNKQLCVTLDFTNGNVNWGYGNKTVTWSSLSTGDFTLYNSVTPRTLVINEHSMTATAATFSNNYNIYLFALNNAGSVSGGKTDAVLRIMSAKMYSSGVLVRDFIPVRKNGVGYMYDKVSDTLFGNANNSGSFNIGPDKT